MKIDIDSIRQSTSLELLARQMVEGFITGLHRSPYHGFSVEFAEHRLYNNGESTKDIDWKVYARTDKLFVKKYAEETNLRCNIVIDTSSSMYYPKQNNGKITFSAYCAAAIAYLLHKQRDAVGLCTFSDHIQLQTQLKSTSAHLRKLFVHLNDVLLTPSVAGKTSIPATLHEIAQKMHKRSLIVIFSDMFDNDDQVQEILSALHHLKHKQHEVILFHVTDKSTEYHFEFDKIPHKFIDLETNETIKVNPNEIKDVYQQNASQYYHDLKVKCGAFKIDFVEADISEPFEKVLNSFLIKRAKSG